MTKRTENGQGGYALNNQLRMYIRKKPSTNMCRISKPATFITYNQA